MHVVVNHIIRTFVAIMRKEGEKKNPGDFEPRCNSELIHTRFPTEFANRAYIRYKVSEQKQ